MLELIERISIRVSKNFLFLKFINKEVSIIEMLRSFSKSKDPYTVDAANELMEKPPNLEDFCKELTDAVSDIVTEGFGKEFTAFVDHYMTPSLEDDVEIKKGERGENVYLIARVKDKSSTWIQGFICYNLCLYIKVFGLSDLKKCKVCSKIFAHKGKWALYCSESCKSNKNQVKK